jgi:hypothetical protein
MSDIEDLEEFERQTAVRVNERSIRRPGRNWGLSPNIARASVSREIAKPPVLIPAASNEEAKINMPTHGGPQEITIISYTELIAGIQARIGELGIRQVDFDKLAGFAEGLTGKVFGASQVKRLGPEKLFDAIRAAGLKLKLEADPEQLERMRKQIAENCQPRQSNQARMGNRSHLSNKTIDDVLSYLANKRGGLTQLNAAVSAARSNWARHAAKALWERKRGTGDFDAYAGNVSRISSAPALRPPEESASSPQAEATAA